MPHAYTSPTCPDAARCWVPCLDSFFDKCTWEFEFVVPKYLEEHDQDIGEDLPDAIATVVVCSGDLVEQVSMTGDSTSQAHLETDRTPIQFV